jgi:spore germination protein GerM
VRRALAALGALLVLAGCGIPDDASPRNVPEPLVPPTPAPPVDTDGEGPQVYFLAGAPDERLQSARRDVVRTPEAVLTELLRGLTSDEVRRRWRSAIPADTVLRSTQFAADGTLVVDLSEAFFEATGDSQIEAVAQVVFTGAALTGVDQVRLLVEGQARAWPRGDGSLDDQPLTVYAYPELNPTSQPDYPPLPSPVTPTAP